MGLLHSGLSGDGLPRKAALMAASRGLPAPEGADAPKKPRKRRKKAESEALTGSGTPEAVREENEPENGGDGPADETSEDPSE